MGKKIPHKASCFKTISETSAAIFENPWKTDKFQMANTVPFFIEGDDDGRWGIMDRSA